MAEDLRPYGVTVNMLLPGGATETGMIPEDMKGSLTAPLLQPDVMSDPIVFLPRRNATGSPVNGWRRSNSASGWPSTGATPDSCRLGRRRIVLGGLKTRMDMSSPSSGLVLPLKEASAWRSVTLTGCTITF